MLCFSKQSVSEVQMFETTKWCWRRQFDGGFDGLRQVFVRRKTRSAVAIMARFTRACEFPEGGKNSKVCLQFCGRLRYDWPLTVRGHYRRENKGCPSARKTYTRLNFTVTDLLSTITSYYSHSPYSHSHTWQVEAWCRTWIQSPECLGR